MVFIRKKVHFCKKSSPSTSVSRALTNKNSQDSPNKSRFPTASINLKKLLSECVSQKLATSSIISCNLREIQEKSLIHEGFLSQICQELREFFEENRRKSSIVAYLQEVFALFRRIRQENTVKEVQLLFEALENLFKDPFESLVLQFSELKALFIEKLSKKQEFREVSQEKRALEEKIKAQSREIAKLRDFLEESRGVQGNSAEILLENEKLRQIVKTMRRNLCEKRRKDGKIMKLLNAIRAEGVDIEGIYQKSVGSSENSMVFEEEAFEIKGNAGASPYEERNFSFIDAV